MESGHRDSLKIVISQAGDNAPPLPQMPPTHLRNLQKECDMDVVTMAGDEFNRKGGISGGYHDERAARLLTLERIRQLGRDLKDLAKQQKGMQTKVSGKWHEAEGRASRKWVCDVESSRRAWKLDGLRHFSLPAIQSDCFLA